MNTALVKSVHPRSTAREYAVQFLYQCECEKIFYYAESHFERFVQNFYAPAEVARYMRPLVEGALNHMQAIDVCIQHAAKNWKLERFAATDRSVLRLAVYELAKGDVPAKVITNEAINLAKKYGTEKSGAFVNGILDNLLKAKIVL